MVRKTITNSWSGSMRSSVPVKPPWPKPLVLVPSLANGRCGALVGFPLPNDLCHFLGIEGQEENLA